MKILVTGALGQLGRELCRQLGPQALPVDIGDLNLTDEQAVLATLERLRPDAVINCAAYTQVDQAEKEPERCRAVNTKAVEYLARGCARLDSPLMHVSTDYVFGGDARRRTPYTEDDPPAPQGVYSQSKADSERIAAAYSKHWIIRSCGLYACPQHAQANHFVKTMLRLAAGGKSLGVVNDQVCSPSYVPHVARAILFLMGVDQSSAAPWGIYHVVNRGATSWYQFAAEIFRQAGLDVDLKPITTAQYNAPAPRPAFSVLNTARYESLGGPELPHWEEALAEYFAERSALVS